VRKVVFCFYTNDHEVNLGIGFISSALKRAGIATDLVIYRDVMGKENDTPEGVVSRILAKNPAVVAFSAMTFNWRRIKEVISVLRKSYDGLVLVGGYQGILSPEEVLAHPGVDGVCVGEGELPMIRTVTAYGNGGASMPEIYGMVFRNQENQSKALERRWLVENLQDYPYIDYDIFEGEGVKGLKGMHIGVLSPGGIFSLPVITGRGCPYKCTYCCNSIVSAKYGGAKSYLRRYDIESAVSNIKGIVTKYEPELIEFFDETFIRNKTWVKDFCSLYRREIGLPFMIMARIDSLDEPLVSAMAESGLKLVLFGLESGDEEYRERYLNRRMSDKTIKEGARLLKKYDIMVVTFNMFGMPFETKEMINKTFALNEEIKPEVAYYTIFQPLPGTELAKIAYEHNMASPPPEGMWDLHSPSLDTAELPASYVVQMIEKFRDTFSNQEKVEAYYSKLRGIVKLAEHSLE
jgi:anaerobic magnesium-protoporphyrin IX monomethyl ester cyclase